MSWATVGCLVKITIGTPEYDPNESQDCLQPILEECKSEKNYENLASLVRPTLPLT